MESRATTNSRSSKESANVTYKNLPEKYKFSLTEEEVREILDKGWSYDQKNPIKIQIKKTSEIVGEWEKIDYIKEECGLEGINVTEEQIKAVL